MDHGTWPARWIPSVQLSLFPLGLTGNKHFSCAGTQSKIGSKMLDFPGKGAPVALGLLLLTVPFREDSKSLDLLKDRASSPLCLWVMQELPGCPGEPQCLHAGKHPLAPNLSLRACGQPDSRRFLALSYALWCQVIRSYPVGTPTAEMGFATLPNPPGSSARGTLSERL